ncbi:MAG: hypothetical protein COC01_06405 [Bacteroidetes bacterium]|nr:MAG: hypothetical protein COC01_06405 [Bacteroidota bacterium]
MKKHTLYILALVFLSSCEEKTDWELKSEDDNRIVVDGMITNERTAHIVRLSKPVSEMNEAASVVSGALVSIGDGDTTYSLIETPDSSGIYITDSSVIGVSGKQYKLTIFYNNNTDTATAEMVPVTPFTPLSYYLNTNDSLYRIGSINDVYDSEPSMWLVLMDWSHVKGYELLDYSSNHAKLMAYTFSSIDVNQIFSPGKESISFPEGTIIVEKKFSLTEEHADFLRALVSETNWRGGFFDVSTANLPTNLSEGAIGYFGASTVIVDTIVVSQ